MFTEIRLSRRRRARQSGTSQHGREVFERDAAELEVAIGVRCMGARPGDHGIRIVHVLGGERGRPVLSPREDVRGEGLCIASARCLRDRRTHRRRELRRRTALARRGHRQGKAAIAQDLPRVDHPPNVSTVTAARFDLARIRAFLELASERLDGEWLLVGGAAAATWFSPARTTEGVDLIGTAGAPGERMAVMELAVAAGIPVEAVNSAADFFVRRIDGWRAHLVPLVHGPRATIYRPDPTLFLLLKIGRMSESDLDDCLALLEHCAASGDTVDRERVRVALETLPAVEDTDAGMRRVQLLARLTA